MSEHANLYVSWAGTVSELRDFIYLAAKCDRYLASDMNVLHGPPEDTGYPAVALFNAYAIVDIFEDPKPWVAEAYGLRGITHNIFFTLNGNGPWFTDCVDTAIDWLAGYPGDADFSIDGGCTLFRRREAELLLDSNAPIWLRSRFRKLGAGNEWFELLQVRLAEKNLAYALAPLTRAG